MLDYDGICDHVHHRRLEQFQTLPRSIFQPTTPEEDRILSYSVSEIVEECSQGRLSRNTIRQSYMKKVVEAQRDFNCVSELVVLDNLDSSPDESVNGSRRLLEGVPVTLKDTIDVANHHSTIGFAKNFNRVAESHSPLVRLLLDAGCILLAKSTVPPALFSISTESPFFSGPTLNPRNPSYGVGASTGGGGAMVASGATPVEFGSDVAGSIRLPAHFTGVFGLKGSMGRFPSEGNRSSMEGIECLKTLGGPLARRMSDMVTVWRAVIEMKPWEYEPSCLPIPWKESELQDVTSGRKLRWGVVWSDGLIPPSPACRRALAMTIDALRDDGHEIVDITPHTPSIPAVLAIGYQLAFGDGCSQILSHIVSDEEPLNLPLQAIIDLVRLPSWKRYLLSGLLYALALFAVGVPNFPTETTDPPPSNQTWITRILDWAFPRRHIGYDFYKDQIGLVSIVKPQTIFSERLLVEARNTFRREWHEKVWKEHDLDFVLTPAAPLPALREERVERRWPLGEDSDKPTKQNGWLGGLLGWRKKHVVGGGDPERAGLGTAGYTFLFNLLDYTAGVVPVTTVDRDLDVLVPPHPEAVHQGEPQHHGKIYETRLPESVYARYGEGRIPLPEEGYPPLQPASPASSITTLVDSSEPIDGLKAPVGIPYYAKANQSYTAFSIYDPVGMHGLPVGVQVVGRQLEEEKVLGAMQVVDDVLRKSGWSINCV